MLKGDFVAQQQLCRKCSIPGKNDLVLIARTWLDAAQDASWLA